MADASTLQERLYALLPTIHRIRDADRGQILRALLGVLETGLDEVREDVDGLYDNWFIETCDPWVVPYIADLLGIEGIRGEEGYSRRAVVANTVGWRRRKGTASVLESVAYAETGWQARAVEFFQRLTTTQHMNHLRSAATSVDLRKAHRLELLGGPFEEATHTAEVRRVDTRQGRYNIPNVGIMLWRLDTYPVRDATARRVQPSGVLDSTLFCYRFDACGLDIPLFNSPHTEAELSALATEIDVPGRLRNRGLAEVMVNAAEHPDEHEWWFTADDDPCFLIETGPGQTIPFDPDYLRFFIAWERSDPTEEETLNDWPNMVPRDPPSGDADATVALVDVERGRLVLRVPSGVAPDEVRVSYRYGFSAKLGGGPYDRTSSLEEDESWDLESFDDASGGIQIGVSREHHQETTGTLDPNVYETLTEALAAWDAFVAGSTGGRGLIVLMDSRTYDVDDESAGAATSWTVTVPRGFELWIVAADWDPPSEDSGYPTYKRLAGNATADGLFPTLVGGLRIVGDDDGSGSEGRLYLNGLRVQGGITVGEGNLGGLVLRHCTQVPGSGRISVQAGTTSEADANTNLEMVLSRCIVGGVHATTSLSSFEATECIIDVYGSGASIALPETDLTLQSVTIFGTTEVRKVSATDTIFVGRLNAALKQEGCLRFCYVTRASSAPRRYRCQPETALNSASTDLEEALEGHIVPSFTTVTYGAPGYAQLRRLCPALIRAGSEEGSEMGAFTFLRQPQRETNLKTALRQYLRFGLSAGHFFVT